MRIGEAAAKLGVAAHVLRHWEDEHVVVPPRTPSGHRNYDEEHLHRLRIVQACQRLGLSLPEIRQILHRDEPGRVAVIDGRLREIRRLRAELNQAERFLGHVRACRHGFVTQCVECLTYPKPLDTGEAMADRVPQVLITDVPGAGKSAP